MQKRFILSTNLFSNFYGTCFLILFFIGGNLFGQSTDCNVQQTMTTPDVILGTNFNVTNAGRVIDTDNTNFATFGALVNLLSPTRISIKKPLNTGSWEAGTMAGFEIQNESLADLSLLGNLEIVTYLNGVIKDQSSNFNLVLVNSVALNGTGRQIIGIETTQEFDEVVLRSVGLLEVNLGQTKIFRFITQKFCDFAPTSCNSQEFASIPEQPIFVNAKNTGIIGAVCAGCEVRNTNYVIDGDDTTHATINYVIQAAGSASISVKLGGNNVIPAGYYVGFDIARDNALTAEVLNALSIKTYLNGSEVESITGEFAVVDVGTDILGNYGRFIVGFVTTQDFDEYQIQFAGVADVNLGNIKVYDAILMNACDGTVNCDAAYYLKQPESPVALSAKRTGQIGLACVACSVTEPDNVIDNDTSNHATLTNTVNVAGSAGLSVVDIKGTYPKGTYAGYTIDAGFPITVNVLETITITTYLDGVQQESKTGVDLIDLQLLLPILGNNPRNVGFETSLPFDEVEIRFSGVAQGLNIIEVYGLIVDFRNAEDESGSPFCTSCTKVPTNSGTVLNTQVGVSTLDRNMDNSWVTDSKSGFIKLESKSLGFVPTRMTTTQRNAIASPVEGMVIYNTTTNCLELYTELRAGGNGWVCTKNKCTP